MAKASEYVVQRIDEDTFELWLENNLLATLTKEEAWPVILGQIHPDDVSYEHEDEQHTDR